MNHPLLAVHLANALKDDDARRQPRPERVSDSPGRSSRRRSRIVGWTYFAIVCVLALVAPVLFIATNGGG